MNTTRYLFVACALSTIVTLSGCTVEATDDGNVAGPGDLELNLSIANDTDDDLPFTVVEYGPYSKRVGDAVLKSGIVYSRVGGNTRFSKNVYSNLYYGTHNVVLSYQNDYCSNSITDVVDIDPDGPVYADFNVTCDYNGLNSQSVSLQTVPNNKESWTLPQSTHINATFTQVSSALTATHHAQSRSQTSVKLLEQNAYQQKLNFKPGLRYAVSGVKSLLDSCDALTQYNKVFQPSVSGKDQSFAIKISLAPQKLIISQPLSTNTSMPQLLQEMQQGGFNVAEFTGVNFSQDASGNGHLWIRDHDKQVDVESIFPNNVSFPAYASGLLVINDAAEITQPSALVSALSPLANMGVVLNLNHLADEAHYQNTLSLVQTLLANHIQTVLQLPVSASTADLQRYASLKAILRSHNDWNGWLQLTEDQIVSLAGQFDRSRLVVNLINRANGPQFDTFLEHYRTLRSNVNGLIMASGEHSHNDVTRLRQTVFLNG